MAIQAGRAGMRDYHKSAAVTEVQPADPADLECSQTDGKGSPNLISSATCNTWTMTHKMQVVATDMQYPFNRNTIRSLHFSLTCR